MRVIGFSSTVMFFMVSMTARICLPAVGASAVVDDGDGAVLESERLDVGQICLHFRPNAAVVGRRCEHDMAAPEALRNKLGDVGLGNVVHRDVLDALVREHVRQNVHRVLGIAVHGRIGNHDGFVLRLVGAPFLVLLEQRAEVFAPDRAVQRQII